MTPQLTNRSGWPDCCVEEMRERAVGPDVFAPDDRIAEDRDSGAGRDVLFQAALVEPVVVAQRIGDAVVGAGRERLDLASRAGASERGKMSTMASADEPLPAAQPHLVDAERRAAVGRRRGAARGRSAAEMSGAAVVCMVRTGSR